MGRRIPYIPEAGYERTENLIPIEAPTNAAYMLHLTTSRERHQRKAATQSTSTPSLGGQLH